MGNITNITKGERYRQVYARRERVTSSLERIPINYDQEFIELKKPERDAYVTGYATNGQRVLVRRLKKEQSYTEKVYTSNPNSSNVLFKVLEKIVDGSDATVIGETIYPKNGGQIEIKIRNGYLGVFSRRESGQLSYAVSKRLDENASPKQILRNVESEIVNRAARLEFNRRGTEAQRRFAAYKSNWENTRKRRFNQIFGNLGDIDPKIMHTALEMVDAA